MKNYGSTIAKLRKEKGMTQKDLGDKLNISYQAVSKWENNLSEPDLATIEKICEIFDISMSEFFGMSNQENKSESQTSKASNKFNWIKNKPWYIMGGLGIIILILALCAFLIPVKYSSSKIYSMVDPAVFCITAKGNGRQSAGSGFFINSKGLAVTNYHVIANCTSGEIQTNDGQTYDILTVVGCDEDADIAIIQIDIKKSPKVSIGNSNKISVGDVVYAIGYPESFQLGSVDSTFTQGIISKTAYTYEGNTYIQTTADFTRGNSGGVLLNESGKVIGITSAMLTDGTVNYMNMAIPINKIHSVEHDINMSMEEYYNIHKTFYYYSNGYIYHSQEFISGDKINPIAEPVRSGYTFKGWYEDEEFNTPFDFTQPVTDKTSCYAKWQAISYTVRFDAGEGSGEMADQTMVYDQETKLSKNTFTKEYYMFDHWLNVITNTKYSDEQTVKNLTATDGGVIELVAQFKDLEYEVVFNAGGGSGTMENFSAKANQTANLPSVTFTKEGYLFDGWDFNGQKFADGAEFENLTINQPSVTLTATWRPIDYTVLYVGEYDTIEVAAKYDQELTLPMITSDENSSFVPEHQKLVGWKIGGKGETLLPGAKLKNLTNVNGQEVSIKAVIEDIDYIVEYYSEETGESERVTVKYSDKTQFNSTLKNEGYFISKFENATTGEQYNVGSTISKLGGDEGEVVRIKIIWQEVEYTLQYMYDYEVLKEVKLKYFEQHTVLGSLKEIPGYAFENWKFSHDTVYTENQTVQGLIDQNGGTVTFNASYRPIKFKIQFDANGGYYSESEVEVEYGQHLELPYYNQPTYAEHTFLGWACGDEVFKHGSAVICDMTTVEGDIVVFKAYWKLGVFSGGDGSTENPYKLSTTDDMIEFALDNTEGKHYILTQDIDFNGGAMFPVSTAFASFDGQGFTIKNVTLTAKNTFSRIYDMTFFLEVPAGATLKDLTLENVRIKKYSSFAEIYVSPLAGDNNGTITNCHVKGVDITAPQAMNGVYLGGFVGANSGQIDRCSLQDANYVVSLEMDTSYSKLSGFAWSNSGTITNSYIGNSNLEYSSMDDDYKDITIAGFVGVNTGTIEYCYSGADFNFVVEDFARTSDGVKLGGFSADSTEGEIAHCFLAGDFAGEIRTWYYEALQEITLSKFAYFSTEDIEENCLFISSDSNSTVTYSDGFIKYAQVDENFSVATDENFTDETWLKEHIFTGDTSMWEFSAGSLPVLKGVIA